MAEAELRPAGCWSILLHFDSFLFADATFRHHIHIRL
jgi:hypothetical protein